MTGLTKLLLGVGALALGYQVVTASSWASVQRQREVLRQQGQLAEGTEIVTLEAGRPYELTMRPLDQNLSADKVGQVVTTLSALLNRVYGNSTVTSKKTPEGLVIVSRTVPKADDGIEVGKVESGFFQTIRVQSLDGKPLTIRAVLA